MYCSISIEQCEGFSRKSTHSSMFIELFFVLSFALESVAPSSPSWPGVVVTPHGDDEAPISRRKMKTYSHPVVRKIPLEQVMYALSDPCRVAIVRALAAANGRELACNQIDLKISKATRSHHFDVLRDSGIVFSRYEGTRCLTSLRTAELDQSFPGLLELVLHNERSRSRSQKRQRAVTAH
jgi:DNA-binding transcriptional ArsR family regulator